MALAGWIVLGPNYGGDPPATITPAKFDPQRPDLDSLPLPPLTPGLPQTRTEACQMLMAAIALQGLADDDLDYVMSPDFERHLLYAGMEPAAVRRVRMRYLRNELDPRRLRLVGDLRGEVSEMANWASWND